VYGALEIPLGPDGAFAVLGGVLLIAGALLWWRRTKIT
jgi:LPXTG-motif cell wall-anchored protein